MPWNFSDALSRSGVIAKTGSPCLTLRLELSGRSHVGGKGTASVTCTNERSFPVACEGDNMGPALSL